MNIWKQKHSLKNLGSLKNLTKNDIIGSINENLRAGNITLKDALKLKYSTGGNTIPTKFATKLLIKCSAGNTMPTKLVNTSLSGQVYFRTKFATTLLIKCSI